jgi:hypothetical protein
MPTYTLKNIKDNVEFDVNCSYDDLQVMLDAQPDVVRVLSTPKIVGSVGNLHSKTDDGWKETLGRIKSGSAKNNTIKI